MKWDRVLSVVISVLAIAGTLWAFYSKPASWDQTTKDVAEMKPKVESHGNKLATVEANYQHILRRLDQINEKLDQ